jgi:acetyl esterase/lipase
VHGASEYSIETDFPYAVDPSDPYLTERCVLDFHYPKQINSFATVIWFHGGGLKGGKKNIPDALKEQGIAVVAPNYRLTPEVKAVTCIEDAAAAVAWVFKNIEKYGGDPGKIFVSGHSAGGYLASMVGLDKSYLAKHGIDANRIAGLIPFSGHTITHFAVRNERGIPREQPVIDKLAPLFHVRADASPLLMITGDREHELLGRYEENAYMMRMMKVAGHKQTRLLELDGYGHGMTQPAFPLLIKEIQEICKEIDEKTTD